MKLLIYTICLFITINTSAQVAFSELEIGMSLKKSEKILKRLNNGKLPEPYEDPYDMKGYPTNFNYKCNRCVKLLGVPRDVRVDYKNKKIVSIAVTLENIEKDEFKKIDKMLNDKYGNAKDYSKEDQILFRKKKISEVVKFHSKNVATMMMHPKNKSKKPVMLILYSTDMKIPKSNDKKAQDIL
ncbi:MAG: hypothetical protein GY909_16030 [Oligoflexia bacterium]|nr:hypothetical protein [Oligoflexia bacterium]